MRYYDNTRISSYKECPRKYFLRHKRNLVREGLSAALLFGLGWHDAQDSIWTMLNAGKTTDEEVLKAGMRQFNETWVHEGGPNPLDLTISQRDNLAPRTPEIAAEMMYNYIRTRKGFIQDCELLGVEVPFAVPIYEDESPVMYIGRLDKVIKHLQYGIIVIEHKTTAWYAKATGFRKDYLEGFSPNSQVDGYIHAGHMIYGEKVSGVWVDAALVHKTEHNRFRFIPIDRQFAMIDQWLHETRDWIDRIELEEDVNPTAKRPDYEGFPKNTGACNIYAGCSYRDLCKFYARPSLIPDRPPGFKVEKWQPFDILKIEQLGLEREDD